MLGGGPPFPVPPFDVAVLSMRVVEHIAHTGARAPFLNVHAGQLHSATAELDGNDVAAVAAARGCGNFSSGPSMKRSVLPGLRWGGTVNSRVRPATMTLNLDRGAAPGGIFTAHVAAFATCSGIRNSIVSPPRFPCGTTSAIVYLFHNNNNNHIKISLN